MNPIVDLVRQLAALEASLGPDVLTRAVLRARIAVARTVLEGRETARPTWDDGRRREAPRRRTGGLCHGRIEEDRWARQDR